MEKMIPPRPLTIVRKEEKINSKTKNLRNTNLRTRSTEKTYKNDESSLPLASDDNSVVSQFPRDRVILWNL
jgi:hypothetical protein